MNNPITMLRAFASNKSFMRKRSKCYEFNKTRIIQQSSYVAISILVISAQSILALAQGDSSSANYPAKPVRILIGFAPGGGTDVVGRIAAQKFTESFGKSFVVENRPGASGNIAANLVAKATPDGYTLLVTADVHTVNASLFSNLPFDPIKDFAAVGTLASGPQMIAVHPSMPRTLRELIALAKAKPGGISYASADPGTISFVAMELFSSMAGIKLLNVPYQLRLINHRGDWRRSPGAFNCLGACAGKRQERQAQDACCDQR